MNCHQCGAEVTKSMERCAECGTLLVDKPRPKHVVRRAREARGEKPAVAAAGVAPRSLRSRAKAV